jgi:hypothetical protein
MLRSWQRFEGTPAESEDCDWVMERTEGYPCRTYRLPAMRGSGGR